MIKLPSILGKERNEEEDTEGGCTTGRTKDAKPFDFDEDVELRLGEIK